MNKLIVFIVISMILFFILGTTPDMPHANLDVHNQDEFSSVSGRVGGRCTLKKCLTIYVAPWCPACKKLKPTIISLKDQLESEGLEVKVIVGKDTLAATKKYASAYPFPTLLDSEGVFYNKVINTGVPFFIVSDNKGKIVNSLTGGIADVRSMRSKLDL